MSGLLTVLAVLASFASPQAAAAPSEMQGWAVELRGGAGSGVVVTTHAEFAALALSEGETFHPEAPARDLTARFQSDVKVSRAGRYRFGVELRGTETSIRIRFADGSKRELVRNAAQNHLAAITWSEWVDAPAGDARLEVDCLRKGEGHARLKTWWEMAPSESNSGFVAEPIPARVVRVPAELAPAVAADLTARRGRVQLSELGCVNCHASGGASAAVDRRGPISLGLVASRSGRAWLERWLLEPQKVKPGCGMPDVFGDVATGKSADGARDARAIVDLLESFTRVHVGPALPPGFGTTIDAVAAARGTELFHEVGCVACHGPFDAKAEFTPPVAFGDLAGKWRIQELAAFLRDPTSVRTHGRMPSLGLEGHEAEAIAQALVAKFGAPAESSPQPLAEVDAAQLARGREAYVARGCASCHVLAEGETVQGSASAPPLEKLADSDSRGCLATAAAARGRAPRYELTEATRAELRAGLASVKRSRAAPAPIDTTQRAFAAFHCGACHERSGADLPEALVPYFKCKVETDLGDEGRLPPRLDGAGSRLRSSWLERVIANGERVRPYLAARMPRFGANVAAHFVDGLAAIEGEWRSDLEGTVAPVVDEALAIAGRKLAGSGGLNCITCHSFGNRPSAGTPGLDFLQFAQRLREGPWRSYALSPMRQKPGTRMPTFFEDGKSSAIAILDGDADRQIDALWAWFQKANAMPAPDGVPTGQRMVLDVGERPKVFRTFLERAGSRGIAVGDPAGLHFAFDAEQIRLCEAWSGEFLDVAPVWTARGGHVAPQLGPVVWSAPPGPALLLEKPEGAWPTDSGRNHGLKFGGYRLEPDGRPVFLWDLRPKGTPPDEPSGPDAVHVEETFVPDPRAEVLFVRTFRVTNLPAGVWLYYPIAPEGFLLKADAKKGVTAGTDRVTVMESLDPLTIRFEVKP